MLCHHSVTFPALKRSSVIVQGGNVPSHVPSPLRSLALRYHPIPGLRCAPPGARFRYPLGYVVFADGLVQVRAGSVTRFDRRYRRMGWQVNQKMGEPLARVLHVNLFPRLGRDQWACSVWSCPRGFGLGLSRTSGTCIISSVNFGSPLLRRRVEPCQVIGRAFVA